MSAWPQLTQSVALWQTQSSLLLASNAHHVVEVALDGTEDLEPLRQLLADPTVRKLGYNVKSLVSSLAEHKISVVAGLWHDVGIAQQLLGLASELPSDSPFVWLSRLHKVVRARLRARPRVARWYRDHELVLVPILRNMETLGMRIDVQRLEMQKCEARQAMLEIPQRVAELTGRRPNMHLFSTRQIVAWCSRNNATDFDCERLVDFCNEWRNHKSTFEFANRLTPHLRGDRVHTTYKLLGSVSGRMSSAQPCLQNVPNGNVRKCFVARPAWKIVVADYSQIELVILAHLSGDPMLVQQLSSGMDVHAATAAKLFSTEKPTEQQRAVAKEVNFGLVYGMRAWGLANRTGLSLAQAHSHVKTYFNLYSGVHEYMKQTKITAAHVGHVTTLAGRRVALPHIRSPVAAERHAAERLAINAPTQGTAAEIIKRAMLAIAQWLDRTGTPAAMLLTVHDELVLEADPSVAPQVARKVAHLMQKSARLSLPMRVAVGIGENWYDAKTNARLEEMP